MRDIKFRAWDKKRKYIYEKVLSFDMCDGAGEIVVGGKDIEDDGPILVKDVVLMQYTGLKDQNGKEIYEGDIIINPCVVSPTCPHCKKKLYAERQPEVVKWNDFSHRFDMPYRDAFQTYLILGNIHENPELLKK